MGTTRDCYNGRFCCEGAPQPRSVRAEHFRRACAARCVRADYGEDKAEVDEEEAGQQQ